MQGWTGTLLSLLSLEAAVLKGWRKVGNLMCLRPLRKERNRHFFFINSVQPLFPLHEPAFRLWLHTHQEWTFWAFPAGSSLLSGLSKQEFYEEIVRKSFFHALICRNHFLCAGASQYFHLCSWCLLDPSSICSKCWTPDLPPRVRFQLQDVQDRVVTPSMGSVGACQSAPSPISAAGALEVTVEVQVASRSQHSFCLL